MSYVEGYSGMINQALVVGDVLFSSHRDRALYLSRSVADRQQWLEEHKDNWRDIDPAQEPVRMAAPAGDIVLRAENSEAGEGATRSTTPREKAEMSDTSGSSRRHQLACAAVRYRDEAGWVPLCLKGKQPVGSGWQKRTLTDQIPVFQEDSNIGILLGRSSGGLVRMDYDLPQVPGVHEELFPPSPAFGRTSAPSSGRLILSEGVKTTNFVLPKSMKDDPR